MSATDTDRAQGDWRRRAGTALADWFARATHQSPQRLRELAMRSPARRPIVAGIFKGMEREFDRERAGDLEAVVHWELGGEGEEPEVWQLTIAEGRCRASRGPTAEPRVTFALDHPTFLELAAGIANGPQLFMSGRLKLRGDMMLAQRLTALFRVPKPRAAPASGRPAGG